MLFENKFSKYLLYAIGEIILVVIGILIALGINNWNVKMNTKIKERDALTEIFQDLESDNALLKRTKIDEENIIKSIEILISEYSKRGSHSEDSLQTYLGKALVANRLKFVNTAYNVLLSSDIGLIQDKSIRYLIAQYYEKEIPRVERDAMDTYNEWYDAILPIIREEADYWKWDEILVPNSMSSIFENEDLFKILKTNIYNHYGVFVSADAVLKENEKLLEKIETLIQK